jgi:hypothetical protein
MGRTTPGRSVTPCLRPPCRGSPRYGGQLKAAHGAARGAYGGGVARRGDDFAIHRARGDQRRTVSVRGPGEGGGGGGRSEARPAPGDRSSRGPARSSRRSRDPTTRTGTALTLGACHRRRPRILELLRSHEPATPGDITVELAVGAPTASEAVGSLVAKGLVRKDRPQPTREPSPSRSHARGTKRRRGRRDGPTSSERRWTSWMPSSKRRSCRG